MICTPALRHLAFAGRGVGGHDHDMRFELVPTLERLRAVYRVPRGPARFQAYIDAVVGGARLTAEVALPPLIAANPMARGQALTFVERWIALDAEGAAHAALPELQAQWPAQWPQPEQRVRVGLSVLDDVGGGWTNRVVTDAARFRVGQSLRRTGWLSVPLWTSEEPSLEALRLEVREVAWRAAQVARHGDPQSLRESIRQEGAAAAFAGRSPTLEPGDLEYTRAVITPHLDSTHQPTVLAALYGDEGARAWGYPPLGLSRNAGFELALALEKQAGQPTRAR